MYAYFNWKNEILYVTIYILNIKWMKWVSLRNLITPRGLGFCTLLRGFINLLGADKHNSLLYRFKSSYSIRNIILCYIIKKNT